jgi:hypothetical protein
MVEFASICAGAALAALLLAGAHMSLWERRSGLWLVWRYVIGVACLNTGTTLTGLLLGNVWLAVVPWCIAGPAGLVVACLHLWREREDAPAAKALLRRVFKEYRDGEARGHHPSRD